MGKDLKKKTRGPWWHGWVRYSYYDPFDKCEREGKRYTDYQFATAGQAHRAASDLGSALAAPEPRYKWRKGGGYSRSKTDKRDSRLKVLEVGADRVD